MARPDTPPAVGGRSRRAVLGLLAAALTGGLAGGGLAGAGLKQRQASAARSELESARLELESLRRRVAELSYNSASGGGVNLKLLPHPETGQPTVPLAEVFSFDRHHAMCRVDTNPQAFRMPTFSLGQVDVEAHRFYMAMRAISIEQYRVETLPDGARRVVMRGGLDCSTEVGQAELVLGSRTAAEHATYRIEAVDRGVGGGEAGDSFAFTIFFDPDQAPLNHAVFGPEATFTGEMIEGEITIVDAGA